MSVTLDDAWIKTKIPDTCELTYARIWGSHAHNTALDTSDIDLMAVYQAPTKSFLGLKPIIKTIHLHKADGHKYDLQAHELSHFCLLLLKGNPSIVECLFTPMISTYPYTYEAGSWFNLCGKARQKFLTIQSVKQYIGYAQGQLDALVINKRFNIKGGKYNEKSAYHLMRVINNAWEIISGNDPIVYYEDALREFYMKIRRGEYSKEKIIELGRARIAEVSEKMILNEAKLPDKADEVWLNQWLINQRAWI